MNGNRSLYFPMMPSFPVNPSQFEDGVKKEEDEVKLGPQPSTSTASDIPVDIPVSVKVEPATVAMKVEKVNECGLCGIVSTPLLTEDGKEGTKEGDFEMSTVSPHGRVYKHAVNEDEDTFWISCDGCRQWFHGRCVNIEEFEDSLIEKFYCRRCSPASGQTKYRECFAPHRLQYDDPEQVDQPMEIGTKTWVQWFAQNLDTAIPAPDDSYVEIYEDGFRFTETFNRDGDWTKVYLIKDPKGLELRMPSRDFSTADLVQIFGEHHLVDTIDVYRQMTHSMSLGAFHARMQIPAEKRDRLYNFLSLEFSKNEKMKDLVAPPILVYELSFVHKFWPDKSDPINYEADMDFLPESACWAKEIEVAEEHKKSRPDVALFCLCGMGGSYTDFHIDFGGSSVWYHIFKGQKIFYIAPPTEENLKIFEAHQKMERRTETFLGRLLPEGQLRRVVINEGETLMIPSGWIHAVYTPVDSLVFGGNFLHQLNIPMQLRIYDIEQNVRSEIGMDEKFLFPQFELVHWYAARSMLLSNIKEDNDQGKQVGESVFRATKAILPYLKKWLEKEESKFSSNGEVLKKLSKEFENQLKMRDDDFSSGGSKSSKKKKSKKRRSVEDSDDNDDDYRPMKPKRTPRKAKEPVVAVAAVAPPTAEESLEKTRTECDVVPNEPVGLRLTKQGTQYVSEIVDKPAVMIGEINMAQMFARTSSSGRTPKPASWLAATAGDEIIKEAKKLEDSGEAFKPREPVTYSKTMDALMAAEDKEDEFLEDKKKRPKPATAADAAPPKKKPSTTKQRLANKLGLRR